MRIELLLLCTLFGSLFISSIFMGVRLSEIARDLRQYCFHPIFGPFHRSSFNSNGGFLVPPNYRPVSFSFYAGECHRRSAVLQR